MCFPPFNCSAHFKPVILLSQSDIAGNEEHSHQKTNEGRSRTCKLQSGCTAIEFLGNTAYDESMKGFGAIEWLARGGFLV